MKRFTFKGVLENFRTSLNQQNKNVNEIEESLRKENFDFAYTIRHGFPHGATSLAYDPVQNLLAIGTDSGFIRIFGKPGIDIGVKHVSEAGVQQILFIINEGLLISACADDTLHLWNIKPKQPTMVHSLKFQRERITYSHLPFQSKWLYVGTERGNIHVVNVDSFKLSGYVINWNKTIALISKAHPGPIVHISDNPVDSNKLLIGFESGSIVLWDLKNKAVDSRFSHNVNLCSVSWHYEGKSFISSHSDGSLITWVVKQGQASKPSSIIFPHARSSRPSDRSEHCSSIDKVEWKTTKTGENLIIFSGGLCYMDKEGSAVPTMTVMQGKSTTVLEMENPIVDFLAISRSPYPSEPCEPSVLTVLYCSDLVLVDLTTQGFPCFENPFALDVHESPVTVVKYFADCPGEIIPLLYSVGMRQKKTGYSEKNWPLTGGEGGKFSSSYPEIILTGHADGTVKFWDASAMNLQILYRLKSSKLFERQPSISKKRASPSRSDTDTGPDNNYPSRSQTPAEGQDDSEDVYKKNMAVAEITFDPGSRYLAVVGGGDVPDYTVLYSFDRSENRIPQIPYLYVQVEDDREDLDGSSIPAPLPTNEPTPIPPPRHKEAKHTSTLRPYDLIHGNPNVPVSISSCLKKGALKQLPGFQVELVIFLSSPLPSSITETAGQSTSAQADGEEELLAGYRVKILAVKIQPLYGLIAIGTTSGLCIIDFVNKSILINLSTPDFYGSNDPFSRSSKQPNKRPPSTDPDAEKVKSPSLESACCCRSTAVVTPEPVFVGSLNQGPNTITINNLQSPPGPESLAMGSPTSSGLGFPLEGVVDLAFYHQALGPSMASKGGNQTSISTNLSAPSTSNTSGSANQERCINEICGPLPPLWLWMGTSYGSTLVLSFTAFTSSSVPFNSKNNAAPVGAQQPVIVSPTGLIIRLKGSMLNISYFTNPIVNQTNMSSPSQPCAPTSATSKKAAFSNTLGDVAIPGPTSSVTIIPGSACAGSAEQEAQIPSGSGTMDGGKNLGHQASVISSTVGNREFAILISECQACAVAMPSMSVTYKVKTATEGRKIMTARVCKFYNQHCLTCYSSNGHIVVYSVPSFRLLFDIFLVSPSDLRFNTEDHEEITDIRRVISFSSHGNGLYLCSPSEIQKFTYSAELCKHLSDMTSRLFRLRETPEPPKPSFFTNLFNNKSLTFDREELFGEASGKYSRAQATHIPGPSSLALQDTAQNANALAAGPVQKARLALNERGEKLGDLDERMAQMAMHAEGYSKNAHDIMLKYKEKKWYQF